MTKIRTSNRTKKQKARIVKQVRTLKKLKAPKALKKSDGSELKRHLFIFRTLSGHENRDIILRNAPLKLYKVIRLLFKLMMNGTFPLKAMHRSKLVKWSSFIKENSKGKDIDVRRRVSQNGKGLSDILKTVLPIITPMLSLLI